MTLKKENIYKFGRKQGAIMLFKVLTKSEQDKYDNEILDMLRESDDEFVPPLSARSSTTQSDLTQTTRANNGVLNYFEEVKKQKILIAVEDEKLLAFVSFKENFVSEKIGEECLPNIYISTVLVSPNGRGRGITGKMYGVLFEEYENTNVLTRTWSTNEAHIKILSKLDFEKMSVIKNDRGEGIDTVYFKRSRNTV